MLQIVKRSSHPKLGVLGQQISKMTTSWNQQSIKRLNVYYMTVLRWNPHLSKKWRTATSNSKSRIQKKRPKTSFGAVFPPEKSCTPSTIDPASSMITYNAGTWTNSRKSIHTYTAQAHKSRFVFQESIIIFEYFVNFDRFAFINTQQRTPKLYQMDGINCSYVYVGAPGSSFGFHLEDGNLASINYLHRGKPKIW